MSSGDEAAAPKPATAAKPMSRFLRSAGDDSSDESDFVARTDRLYAQRSAAKVW